MRIKLLVGRAGPRYSFAAGHVAEFPDNEARKLIAAGDAVPVTEPEVETAMVDQGHVETRFSLPDPRPKKTKRKA